MVNAMDRARKVWRMEAKAIEKLQKTIHPDSFYQVIKLLKACKGTGKRVLITGKGTSGAVARKVAHDLCCVDIPTVFLSLGEGVSAAMGLAQPGDLLILISKGGSADEILRFIKPAHKKGVTTVGITHTPASPLALKTDHMLHIPVDREVNDSNSLATAGTNSLLAVFDAIEVILDEDVEL